MHVLQDSPEVLSGLLHQSQCDTCSILETLDDLETAYLRLMTLQRQPLMN